jgi:nucleoside-diphosphate-sugar epimerase
MTATDASTGPMTSPPAPHAGETHSEHGGRRRSAVLVTGAAGEVGHGLIHALAGSGVHDVVAIDVRELDTASREVCRDTYIGDICDTALLGRLLAMYEITEIFHLAALLSTRSEFTPETAHDVNVGGTINLLRLAAEQARSHGHPVKFILPSSIAAHGLPSLEAKHAAGMVHEDEHCQPTTMYGCNKLYCEHLGRYYSKYYRRLAQDRVVDALDFRCLRYPGLISAFTVPSGGTSDFAPEMIHAAAEGEAYDCFVRPETRIPFMTMPEAIDATLQLAAADRASLTRSVYAVSSFSASAGRIAEKVQAAFPGAVIDFVPDEARQSIVDSWPEDVDTGAARADWGFAPTYGFDEAFDAYLVPAIRRRYA